MNSHSILTLARTVAGLLVRPASAHCDTEDGPAVTDGRRALDTGNINHALKWVREALEAEVRAAFDQAMQGRAKSAADTDRTDRVFLETLVRVHRAGEGEDFDGIKPTGTELPPQVVAADRAIEERSIEGLRGLVPEQRWPELERRFDRAMARSHFDVDDLNAARDYIEAYVEFFTYAEGEEDHAEHAHHH